MSGTHEQAADRGSLVVAVAVSIWTPWLALVLAVLQSAPVILELHRSPAGYRHWF